MPLMRTNRITAPRTSESLSDSGDTIEFTDSDEEFEQLQCTSALVAIHIRDEKTYCFSIPTDQVLFGRTTIECLLHQRSMMLKSSVQTYESVMLALLMGLRPLSWYTPRKLRQLGRADERLKIITDNFLAHHGDLNLYKMSSVKFCCDGPYPLVNVSYFIVDE